MIVLAILLALSTQAREPDCETIRAQVSQHGKIKAYTWALSRGYTPREISRIRKACGI